MSLKFNLNKKWFKLNLLIMKEMFKPWHPPVERLSPYHQLRELTCQNLQSQIMLFMALIFQDPIIITLATIRDLPPM
jgi:hypothetical protein